MYGMQAWKFFQGERGTKLNVRKWASLYNCIPGDGQTCEILNVWVNVQCFNLFKLQYSGHMCCKIRKVVDFWLHYWDIQ